MQGESFAAKLINVSLFTRRRKKTAPDPSRPTMLQTFKINTEHGNPHL
jgi:hypothetical protein